MEQWEALIDACPAPLDFRYFTKAIQTAGVVLKGGLAPFEVEWILQTLLYKPINLLNTVSTKRTDDVWSKAIGDSFKLLGELTDNRCDDMEMHFEEIVDKCLLPFDAQTRIQALHCLTSVARVSVLGAKDVYKHLASLEEPTTGKAPLALLIGTICEYHPQTVENDINKIWRNYLNLLDSNKNTDTIRMSLLQGILGVFKHFGADLPTAELGCFYDKMAEDYIKIARCEEVCLKILSDHAPLFRERISADMRIRKYLWNILSSSSGTSPSGITAVLKVYNSVCACLHKKQMQQIATVEVLPWVQSHRTQVKYTALRVLSCIQANCDINIQVDGQTDVQTLEFELRNGEVTYDVAEAVSWCIESNLSSSVSLLQSAILFYTHLPSNRRKDIVVRGILHATDELRNTAIMFLISESTQNPTTLENHLPLWKDIFDTDNGKDVIVMDKSKYVFEDFMTYTVLVLDGFLEQGIELLPERLSTLLQLCTQVLTYQAQEGYTNDHCVVLLPLLTQLLKCHPDAVSMCAARCACAHVADPDEHLDVLREFYKVIRIDRCKDEALLCESCLALVQAASGTPEHCDVMMALQITFSRNDVEPQMLCKALRKLEDIVNSKRDNLDTKVFHEVVHHIKKLYNRKDLSGKDARILHRDVLIFLGKYGNKPELNHNIAENTIIVKLMDNLMLNVANPDEGTSYKLNLQRILQLALQHGDPNSLQTLLIILCANLSTKRDEDLQRALSRVVYALSTAHARGASIDARALLSAITMCDNAQCVRQLLQYISEERSPGVRKMLSDALEALLVKDIEDKLTSSVGEYATVMMNSSHSTTKRAGLNLTDTLISSIKENNLLIKNLLPELLLLISKTLEIDSETTFENGSKLFLEKIELFNDDDIEKLLTTLIENLLIKCVKRNAANENKMAAERHDSCIDKMAELEVRIFKNTTKMVLKFIKNVIDYKKDDTYRHKLFEVIIKENNDFEKSLYVLAKYKNLFGNIPDVDRDFLNKFFCMEIRMDEPYFCIESALIFLQEFSELLLQFYQETLQFLGNLIKDLTPQCIKHLHRNIKSCLSVYTEKRTPVMLQAAFEDWLSNLPLNEVTNSIENRSFLTEHSIIVFALKIMLQFFKTATLTDLSNIVQKWPKILLKLFSENYISKYLKSKMSYLTDILAVSVKFLKVTDVKTLILEGSSLDGLPTEKIGIQFYRFFIHVFHDVLVRKPHFLLDKGRRTGVCSIILNDIVKYSIKKKSSDEVYDNVLELVDKLWPIYEAQTTFNQKHSLLLDLNNFPKKHGPESNPMQWAVGVVMSSDASREDKSRLIGVFPGGSDYSQVYRSFASTLPTRLFEMNTESNASLRSLLDALATTGDLVLLDIVMTLASGNDTKGWWDEAIDSCMATIAARGDEALCKAVYTRCWDGLSMGVCRVLLPLLRYSTSSFNEQFFSTILKELLAVKEHKVISTHISYRKSIVDYTRFCSILQVACEKISQLSLESPSSLLYSNIKPTQSWYLIRSICKFCKTMRDKATLPAEADESFKEQYRQFLQANYNCFSAAICRQRPGENIYNMIVNNTVWDAIVDHDKEYNLPIRHQWNQRTTRQATSIAVEGATSLTRTAGSLSSRRVFLRTLSENPLMYDLIEQTNDEEVITQDLQLPSNELNNHPCASTLTALMYHLTTLPHTKWKESLVTALLQCHRNTRWLLAQMICNSKEELKAHASVSRAALLDVVATTPIEVNGKKILNGLHIDILETLIHWGDDYPSRSNNLNSSLQLLVTTCLELRTHKAVFRALLNVLSKFLELYGSVLNISIDVFEAYLADEETSKTLQILQRILKAKINVPSLLPTLITKLESKETKQYYQLSAMAEAIGLALSNSRDRQQYLIRFRKVLDQIRHTSSAGNYVKMLYNAQSGCPDCCDEYNFRMITNLTQKLVGSDKTKCLQILSTYVSTSHSSYIQEAYETIDIPELLIMENVEAFNLVKEGVKILSESMKKRLVMIAAGFCDHSLVKVRKAACGVMLMAFEDLFSNPEEPSAKRSKSSSTPIISKILSKDTYSNTVLSCVASGCVDSNSDINDMVRAKVATIMHKDIGMRFAECFLLTIYLPTISNNKAQNLSVCVSALLDLLLCDLKNQERFKRIRFREEPLQIRITSTAPSKLLTMSRTYQGTFRRHGNLTSKRNLQIKDANVNAPEIDVQIPVERVLDTFLQFSKETPQAAETLCLQLLQAVKPRSELGPEIATALAAILDRGGNELTPFVAEVCKVFIEDLCKVDGIQTILVKLQQGTKASEGESIITLLHREVRLRCAGVEQFVLGAVEIADDHGDIVMEDLEFNIEDLTSAFGKLSNWDSLTVQQKTRIKNSGLPPLWTDKETFKEQLEHYRASISWFDKMAAAYRHEDAENMMSWLREMDRWPTRHFHISAITEAIEWQNVREELIVYPSDIQSSDCLAEWAARFMIRSAHLTSMEESDSAEAVSKSFRLNELQWCERANEMNLGSLVLDCIKRNTPELCESEILPWLHQKVWALRNIGLGNNDSDSLNKALVTANKYTSQCIGHSTPVVVNDMAKFIVLLNRDLNSDLSNNDSDSLNKALVTANKYTSQCIGHSTPVVVNDMAKFILLLNRDLNSYLSNNDSDSLNKALVPANKYTSQCIGHSPPVVVNDMAKFIVLLSKDLNSLTKPKIQEIFEMIKSSNARIDNDKQKYSLYSIYELAMTYYDDLWETNAGTAIDQNDLLINMLDVLSRCTELDIFNEGLLALVMNRLDDCTGILSEDVSKKLLDQIQHNHTSIDDFTLQQLSSHSSLFPSRLLSAYPRISVSEDDATIKYKLCFQLLCDAEYSLLQYCSGLRNALKKNDEDQWDEIFNRMKQKLFDNPYSGTDYQLLNRYKTKLYEICEYDLSSSFKSTAEKVLKEIGRLLAQRPTQSVLRVSQLCPALSHCGECPGKLLGLPDGVAVVRMDEQVTVFDSIRRPVLFKVLLSDGTTRRYLHKTGEPLKVDAAAQKVLRYSGQIWKDLCPVSGYNVTPLSDDCGLIEFLEDHAMLRSLIGGSDVLEEALNTVPRPADHELILSPIQANLAQHRQLCDKTPSYLLRHSIGRRAANQQDLLMKIKSYQHTLASATIITWILGVGDRHLENILYSIQDGRLCHIDWGAALSYGSREIPPARLTRNMLAVCDQYELEAMLQQLLTGLRDSYKLIAAVIKISFKWMDAFDAKFEFIKSTLQGTTLSYNITRQVIETSEMEDLIKHKHLDLLDQVFEDLECKDTYRVEEQISCLLRQCTDLRILSITRSGWEPWV